MKNQEMGGIEPPDDFRFPLKYSCSLVVLATQSSDTNQVKNSRPADSVFLFHVGLWKGLHMTIIPKVTLWFMMPHLYTAK